MPGVYNDIFTKQLLQSKLLNSFPPWVKNGRTSWNWRANAVGEIVCWSSSTLEKSGWKVATSDAVGVTGSARSTPVRDVEPPALAEPACPSAYTAMRGLVRAAPVTLTGLRTSPAERTSSVA